MQISDSEKNIMDVLWNESPQTAKSIINNLDKSLEWQDKTVKTLINRLLKKQAIGYEKEGRVYLYFPLLEESDYISSESENFLTKVFKGKVSNLVAAFAKRDDLSAKDVADLKTLIEELENEKEQG
ncbi:MAG: BlaI/MecI/CopY family transcriptional regulator [Kangiellaceae bacterium]|jgi:BlaI family penicillinase repressor